jgi:hypothetical protein
MAGTFLQIDLNRLGEWAFENEIINPTKSKADRLCDLVIRALDYRFGGPGSIPGTTRKKT